MNACKPTLLLDQENFCVAQCQHCQRVGLTFRNLLLGFTQDEFISLCRTIDGVNFEQNSMLLANGESYLILNTSHPDVQFSLSDTEFNSFRSGLLHALRRLNLYQLLKLPLTVRMEHQHHLKTLTQCENGYIGYCVGCQSYNVAYKNSLFILADSEFASYRNVMAERTAMRPFSTTHGKDWLLLTPMPNYFITLSNDEIDELVQMMDEAALLLEVEQILQTSHRLG